MLSERPNAPFKIVSEQDPALDVFDLDVLREYRLSRDLAVLDLTKCADPPTVFHCSPLRVEHEHLTEDPGALQRWFLFSIYVSKIENAPAAWQIEQYEEAGVIRIKDVCRERIPPDVVAEVAGVIVQRACRGAGRPFILSPDTSTVSDRIRRSTLRALREARASATTTVKNESSS